MAHSKYLISGSCFSYSILQVSILGYKPEPCLSVRLGKRSPFLSSLERLKLEAPPFLSCRHLLPSPGLCTPAPPLLTWFKRHLFRNHTLNHHLDMLTLRPPNVNILFLEILPLALGPWPSMLPHSLSLCHSLLPDPITISSPCLALPFMNTLPARSHLLFELMVPKSLSPSSAPSLQTQRAKCLNNISTGMSHGPSASSSYQLVPTIHPLCPEMAPQSQKWAKMGVF